MFPGFPNVRGEPMQGLPEITGMPANDSFLLEPQRAFGLIQQGNMNNRISDIVSGPQNMYQNIMETNNRIGNIMNQQRYQQVSRIFPQQDQITRSRPRVSNEAAKHIGAYFFEKDNLSYPNYAKAFYFLEQAANSGDAHSCVNAGKLCEEGWGVPQDFRKAEKFYLKGSEGGNIEATYNLALMYMVGKGRPINYQMAEKYLLIAAKEGHCDAQYNLGWMYYEGKLGKVDVQNSIKYYEMAAKQGEVDALYNLGNMFQEGELVKKDLERSLSYFEAAGDKGMAIAAYNAGIIHFEGEANGGEINLIKSRHYLSIASDGGIPEAHYNCGLLYADEPIDDPDIKKAIFYWQRGAEAGEIQSLFRLGELYIEGKGINQNIYLGISMLRQSAKGGYSLALQSLGIMYYKGLNGIPKNIRASLPYFTQAIKDKRWPKLLSESFHYIGEIYYFGIEGFIDPNYKTALQYFGLSDRYGYAESSYFIASIYIEGSPQVPSNIELAIKKLEKAAKYDYSPAEFKLGQLYFDGIVVPKNIPLGIEYLEKAIEHRNLDAMYSLGYAYIRGEDIPQNILTGLEYLIRGAKEGDVNSSFLLYTFYSQGRDGIPKDQENAQYFLNLAAYQGSPEAQAIIQGMDANQTYE